MANMTNNRIGFADWAKFLGLCLVVYGHVPPTDNMAHVIIYSFHMPFFFLVSGMFFSPERFSFKKNTRSLLLPYLVFSLLVVVVNVMISCLLYHKVEMGAIVYSVISIALGSSDSQSPYILVSCAAWFLVALFVVKINAYYILKQTRVSLQLFLLVGEVLIILFLQNYYKWFPFSLDSTVLGTVFFLIGYYFKKPILNLPQQRYRHLIILFAGSIMILSPYNALVNMFEGGFGECFSLFMLFGISGSLFLLTMSSYFNRITPSVTLIVRGAPFIICTHLLLLNYLYLAYRLFLHRQLINLIPFEWWEKLLFTTTTMMISYICIKIIDKYCPAILGR